MADGASPNGDYAVDVLSVMERVADWQLTHPSAHPATDWTQGAGDAGMMALASISVTRNTVTRCSRWAKPTAGNPDRTCILPTSSCRPNVRGSLFSLSRPKNDCAVATRLEAILSAPPEVQSLDFHQPYGQVSQLWSWCDSLFMAPPVWMRLFRRHWRRAYLDFAVKNWWRTTDYLYDPV